MNSDLSKYNFNIRVTGILIEDNKILLVKQKVSEKRNWSLPGGKLERGETLEQGIIRETKEETGLETEVVKLLYICDVEATENTLLHITFLLKRVSGEIQLPTNEFESNPIYDVEFVEVSELEAYGFSKKFIELIKCDFSNAGNYVGDKTNIGLGK